MNEPQAFSCMHASLVKQWSRLEQDDALQAAATTIVASVMHGALIGLDATRKLTIPATARLPAAPPAPGAATADASTPVLEAPAALGADARLDGMDVDAATETGNAEPAAARACTAARLTDAAAEVQWRTAQGSAAVEQQAGCLEASEPECLSADTSHHAQIVPEERPKEWDMAVGNEEQPAPHARQEASSRPAAARQLPALKQTKLLMPSRLPSMTPAQSTAFAGAGAWQQGHTAGRQELPGSFAAGKGSHNPRKRAGQKAMSKATAKTSARPAVFDSYRFDPSAQQQGAATQDSISY